MNLEEIRRARDLAEQKLWNYLGANPEGGEPDIVEALNKEIESWELQAVDASITENDLFSVIMHVASENAAAKKAMQRLADEFGWNAYFTANL